MDALSKQAIEGLEKLGKAAADLRDRLRKARTKAKRRKAIGGGKSGVKGRANGSEASAQQGEPAG